MVNGPFTFTKRRVLWENASSSLIAQSFFDGTSRMVYLTRLRDAATGVNLDHPEDIAILSSEDLAFILYKIEQDARLSKREKNMIALAEGELPF